MRVLITGGCGFIGSYVAERFAKEGCSVYIIDNLAAGGKDTINNSYKFYNLDITDRKCERVFQIHNFDIVVHLAGGTYEDFSDDGAYLGSGTDVVGLINMLNFSHKYGVKKFIFASSTAVYGNKTVFPVKEDASLEPVSFYGVNKAACEFYCRKWQELYGLNTIILRLTSIYGPSCTSYDEAEDIPGLIKKVINQDDIVINGDVEQTRDYIYVEEAAYIIYQIAVKNISEKVINISTNTEVSLKEVLEKLARIEPIKNISYEKKRERDIVRTKIDNTILVEKLKWQPKYTLDEGLERTYEWYRNNYNKPVKNDNNLIFKKKMGIIRPYLENISMFAVLWFINFRSNVSVVDSRLGVDYNYIYIALMGFLYGKKQSIIATVLSCALFTANFLTKGSDWVALIYQSQYLIHLATYLCVGVVTGFAIDNKDRIIKDITKEIESLKQRHDFLEKIHIEANQIKDDLYGQIVNTDDSIGKVYNIVRNLDTLEMEKIYTAATDTLRSIMKAGSATLYTVNKNETYLRLKTKAGEDDNCRNSLKIEEYPYLQTLMTSKRVFVNKNMDENCPDMAAPVLYQGRVFAVVQVHNLPFGNFTLFYENLFRITTMFITDALIKAYLYSDGIKEKKYLKNTNILVAEEFGKVCHEIENRRDMFNQPMALLKITEKPDDYESFYQKISPFFRAEEYIGLKEDGHVYILLSNIIEDTVVKVQDRLRNIAVASEIQI